MNRSKVYSYLGFAAKSRNLISGYNSCIMGIERGKVKLLIVTEGISDNTVKKLLQKCDKYKVEYRIFGNREEIGKVTGNPGNGVFAITDSHFSEIICKEIDQNQSERKVFQ